MVVKDLNKILSKCCQDVNMPADCNVLCQYGNKDENSKVDVDTLYKWRDGKIQELKAGGKDCVKGAYPTTMKWTSCYLGE